MLTNLDPEYQFTDGPAYVVEEWEGIREGDEIMVYIPSLMPEIQFSPEIKETTERTCGTSVFLNSNHPNMGNSVTAINYITGKVTDELVVKKSNVFLEATATPRRYITHIPRQIKLEKEEEVKAESAQGTFKDIFFR